MNAVIPFFAGAFLMLLGIVVIEYLEEQGVLPKNIEEVESWRKRKNQEPYR